MRIGKENLMKENDAQKKRLHEGSMNDLESEGELVVCKNCKETAHKKCIRWNDKVENIHDYLCCNCHDITYE